MSASKFFQSTDSINVTPTDDTLPLLYVYATPVEKPDNQVGSSRYKRPCISGSTTATATFVDYDARNGVQGKMRKLVKRDKNEREIQKRRLDCGGVVIVVCMSWCGCTGSGNLLRHIGFGGVTVRCTED